MVDYVTGGLRKWH